MKTLYPFLIIFLFFTNIGSAREISLEAFFNKADKFLSQNTEQGQVKYANVKENSQLIDELYQQVGNMSLENATDQEKKAFYINAYNLVVIHAVSKYYPLKSPMDKSGFFDKLKHKVAGEEMTLNFLEIKKLIIPYGDPEIHFAVACAAQSCPLLAEFAYTPEKLDQQLERRTKKAINDPEFIRVNPGQNKVAVSKIFDWYEDDFTQGGQSIIEFLNKYRSNKIPKDYDVTHYPYNWELNVQS